MRFQGFFTRDSAWPSVESLVMKNAKHLPTNTPSNIVPNDGPRRDTHLVHSGRAAANESPKPQDKVRQSPASDGIHLHDEIERNWKNPRWTTVEKLIRELDPGHFNSFACLNDRDQNYVQCLRGFNGWHLEWRMCHSPGSYVHYRASYPGGSRKPFELKKHDSISDGQHRDLLQLEDVIAAFRSFHQGSGLPDFLEWREMAI